MVLRASRARGAAGVVARSPLARSAALALALVACGPPPARPAEIAPPEPEPVEEPVVEVDPDDPRPGEVDDDGGGYEGGSLPTSRGTLPVAEIDRVFEARFSELEACYKRLLRRDASAGGTIRFHFTIGTSGAMKNLKVRSEKVRDAKFLRCSRRAMVGASFPPPRGGEVSVIYPVNLSR